ncbi:MAG: hypothetical protein JST51_11010 [Armatimonadetes bacterium]|nr:hypothetical protein [Armatimonadota bacterium]
MNRLWMKGFALAAGYGIFCCHAEASTNLINFPIADILAHREVAYSIGVSGFAQNVDKGFAWSHGVTLGCCDKGEIGITQDLLGHTVYDGKIRFVDDPKQGFAASFGIANYDADAHTNDAYLSLRKDFTKFRFHATAYRSDKVVGVFGVDFPCCCWAGAIEHVTGSDSQTWIGFTSPNFYPGLSATVASRLPWNGNSEQQYQLILNYGLRF